MLTRIASPVLSAARNWGTKGSFWTWPLERLNLLSTLDKAQEAKLSLGKPTVLPKTLGGHVT